MQAKHDNSSEVARLLDQIETECIAARCGLTGFAECAKHATITARMENMHRLYQNLHAIVGDDAARLMVECLEKTPEMDQAQGSDR